MADSVVPFLGVEGSSDSPPTETAASHPGSGLVRVCFAGILIAGAFAMGTCRKGTPRVFRDTALAAAVASPKVKVRIYGMAGCPFTRGFIEGPVVEVIDTVPELVDLEIVPFGNSYYPTKTCNGSAKGMHFASYNSGYNSDERQCWDRVCGLDAAKPAADCFTGDLICQHGTSDCMVTSAWACAKALSNNTATAYIPFFQCTAHNFLEITSKAKYREVVTMCAKKHAFDAEKVLTCAASYDTLNAEGRRTPMHATAPYASIDGEMLADTHCVICGDGIMSEICAKSRAKSGQRSNVCDAILR